MRLVVHCALTAAALALLGSSIACSGGGAPATSPAELATSPIPSANLAPLAPGATLQHTAGEYAVTVDPVALTATATPLPTRAVQQSELFTLSIAEFMRPNTFKITGVTADADSIDLTYNTTHPFAAPVDVTAPPSGANRADLAVTGRVLWLIDDPDLATYFPASDAVSVNTRLVHNPDGYLMPDALITDPGTTTNTFPFQLLTNEALDNREGLSNGGSATGNYGPLGWQRAEFTDGITGYGIWGQGQTTTHTIELDRSTISTMGSFTVKTAIVVKYEDPRGGTSGVERRSNRLPQDDVARFAYRMPHGALDVESIAFVETTTGWIDGELGIQQLRLRVTDWDARATEAAQAHLADEADPTLVSAGESGLPIVEVDIPAIASTEGDVLAVVDDDSAWGGDVDADSGHALDALFYEGTLSGTPSAAGSFTGLIRAIDPTDVSPPFGWDSVRRNLAPDLSPLSTMIEGTVYQAFTVEVDDAGTPPVSSWTFTSSNTVTGSGLVSIQLATPTLSVTNLSGDYTVEVTWGDGSPVVPVNENIASGVRNYSHTYTYSGTPPTPQVHTVSVHLIDGDDPLLNGPATPPVPDTVTVNPAPAFAGWAKRFGGGSLDFGFDTAVAPDGSVVLVGGVFNTVDFGGGPHPNGGSSDPYIVKLSSTGAYLWSRTYPGTGNDFFRSVAVDSAGSVYAHGEYEGTLNFGGSPLTSAGAQDGVIVKLDNAGVHQWSLRYGATGSETSTGAVIDPAGRLAISGYSYSAPWSIPGGPATVFSPHYLIRLTSAGAYSMQYTVNCGGAATGGLAANPAGGYVLTGGFSIQDNIATPGIEGANFGGGPRPSAAGAITTDIYFVGISDAGGYLWDYTAGANAGHDYGQGVAVLTSGTTIGLGEFYGTVNFGGSNLSSAGGADIAVIALNASGTQLSATRFGSSGSDLPYDIDADTADNYLLACSLGGSANFSGGSVGGGAAVVKFNAAGTWAWNNVYGPSGSARAVDCGPGNTVYAGGDFQGTADFEPGGGVFNLSSAGSIDAFITAMDFDGTW